MSNCKCSVLRASSAIVVLLLIVFMLGGCGGGTTTPGPTVSTTGVVTTNMSDPPTCGPPAGQFSHVWVTITRVRAHTSADTSLDINASGWIDLVNLTSSPKQLDLLSLVSTTCLLNQLGSISALPPGNYQQIRIVLLSNTPSSGVATPSPNNCVAASAFNCVVLASAGSVQALQLSSEATTGIKVPPGQIAGGGISLTAGQSTDINIDFNSCASIVQQGNGTFRLKPTLTAGVVSTAQASNSISGQIVDSVTKKGVPNAIVLLEQLPSGSSSEQIVHAGVASSDGTFIFCPLSAGNYDVVSAAEFTSPSGVTTTYNATVTFNVPQGTSSLSIPIVAETGVAGASTLPGTISGQITTVGSASGTPVAVTVTFLPFQPATKASSVVQVIIPVLGSNSQPASLMSVTGGSCPSGTACANYRLLVPASNPQFGSFSSSGTTYSPPGTPPVNYTVTAQSATCTPSSVTSGTIIVAAGGPSVPTATNFALTGCTSP